MNREGFFKLVQMKAWGQIIRSFQFGVSFKPLYEDVVIRQFIDNSFIDEFLKDQIVEPMTYVNLVVLLLEIHNDKYSLFKLSELDNERLIIKIARTSFDNENYQICNVYASKLRNNKECERLKILTREKLKEKELEWKVKNQNLNILQFGEKEQHKKTISLFRSEQEQTFYSACLSVFPSQLIYPNVAINAVIDFNLLKGDLTQEERNYFFMGLIDCVIISPQNEYKPIHFIELDSVFHDTENQKRKDKYKNKIISLSGHQLYRIRAKKSKPTIQEFKTIIQEVIIP